MDFYRCFHFCATPITPEIQDMARPLRIEYPGAAYHVMNRGNRRQQVFHSDRDYETFLLKLEEVGDTYQIEIRSFCLMPNHFHLYLCTPEGNLSRFMQALLTSFTVTKNRRDRRSGHLFQGRFKSILVEEELYGSEVSRYIHLNPITRRHPAEMELELKQNLIREFRWSSFG